MKAKWILLLLSVCFLVISSVSYAGEVYAIIIADTTAENIDKAIKEDLKTIRGKVNVIARYIEMPLKELAFDGDNVKMDIVLPQIEALSFQPDDLVIFFFSGHGYRTNSKGDNPWPNLYFSKEKMGIDYLSIVQKLADKNPRLLLAVADCCNNVMMEQFAPPMYPKFHMSSLRSRIKDNYRQLFVESSGVIVVSSSKAGEFSWALEVGSLYSGVFFESLQHEVSGYDMPSWQTILDRAAYAIQEHQNPQYVILPRSQG